MSIEAKILDYFETASPEAAEVLYELVKAKMQKVLAPRKKARKAVAKMTNKPRISDRGDGGVSADVAQ